MRNYLVRLAQYPAPIRIVSFLLALVIPWLAIAIPIYLLISDRNLVTILTMVPLAIGFFLFLPFWGKYVHGQPHIYRHYGIEITRLMGLELLRGLAIGLISILILFSLEGMLGWLVWQQPSIFLLRVILEGSLTALGVGFAEELFFRGWIYDELQRDYHRTVVLWADAAIFAGAHFLEPLPVILRTSPQFFGLFLLGLAVIWAKRRCQGRLGLSIGLHGGLIWGYYIINVGNLIKYSRQVPVWVTGVNDNPLAGVMGLAFLLILALWMRQKNF